MALTGREVGRLTTTAAITLLLGLLAILLVTSRDSGPSTPGGDGRSVLEALPEDTPPAQPTSAAPAPAAPSGTPTRTPGPGRSGVPSAPDPAGPRTPATAPPSSAAPPQPPSPAGPVPDLGTPEPAATPTPTSAPLLISATSPLPVSCVRVGQACAYVDAPPGTRTGSGPGSVSVSVLPGGRISVSARAAGDAVPAVVGLVVRVCACDGLPDEDVVFEARLAGASGTVELDLLRDRDLQVWVQELNEAGLGPGAVQQLPAVAPTSSPTAPPPTSEPPAGTG